MVVRDELNFFLRRGYAVYIMEQVGRSRSGYAAEVDGPQSFSTILSVEEPVYGS